jgi:hypothetical protein
VTPKQFESLVRLETSTAPDNLVRAFINMFERAGRTNEDAVTDCVRGIKDVAVSWPEPLPSTARREFPSIILESEQALLAIQPWIENVRASIFQTRKKPFRSYKKAVEWIVMTAEAQPRPTAEEILQAMQLRRKIIQKCEVLADLLKGGFKFDTPLMLLSYPSVSITNGSRWVERVPITKGSPLSLLHIETARMEKATGFQQAVLVEHVLTGVPVVFPPARIYITPHSYRLPGPEANWLNRTDASFHFPSPKNLDSRYLQHLFRCLRSKLGLTRKKRLNNKDKQLVNLIKRLGGEPQNGRTVFWERLRKTWNKRYRSDPYGTWRGLQIRYRRIRTKL